MVSASPELLEALQEAIGVIELFHGEAGWETYRDQSPEMKRFRAAITKATGG